MDYRSGGRITNSEKGQGGDSVEALSRWTGWMRVELRGGMKIKEEISSPNGPPDHPEMHIYNRVRHKTLETQGPRPSEGYRTKMAIALLSEVAAGIQIRHNGIMHIYSR